MKKNRGQALVEFVIILPIFFIIIFSAIDLGNIIYKKYHMESDLDFIVDLYKQKKIADINSYVSTKGLRVSYKENNDTVKIAISQEVSIITPGVNIIFHNPYTIIVDRVIYNEK